MNEKRIEFTADEQLTSDFDRVAEFNHMNRAVYLRTLMVDAIKKAQKQNPELLKK